MTHQKFQINNRKVFIRFPKSKRKPINKQSIDTPGPGTYS